MSVSYWLIYVSGPTDGSSGSYDTPSQSLSSRFYRGPHASA
jgi:hypothetical protein